MMTELEESLAALVSFSPKLHSMYFLGGPESSGAVSEFIDLVYRSGWVDMSFDWTAWETGRAFFLEDHGNIAKATPNELRMLITSIARMDRFSEGYIVGRLEDGTLRAIVDRSIVLLAEKSGAK